MSVSIARRSLLRGRFSKTELPPLRPPGSLPESIFIDLCSRCDACLKACSSGILVRGSGGYPEIDFQQGTGECTFCDACLEACAPGAITHSEADARPWTVYAAIGADCLSAKGVTCRVCGDVCETRAIRFKLAVGGIADPVLDAALCTGCGACAKPCPTGAITLIQSNQESSA